MWKAAAFLLIVLGGAAIGRAASAAADLDVTYIERTPRYLRYEVWYSPPGYNPYLRPGTENDQRWPNPGETVTFTAHVKNKGDAASGSFTYRWLFDGAVVRTGTAPSLSPNPTAEFTDTWQWTWDSEWADHTVAFEVDYTGAIAESCENNNIVEDPTNALTFHFHVEQTTYNWFAAHANGKGSKSWEDWAQIQIAEMNRLFREAITPLTPDGILERVRLDKITIHADGTLPSGGTHAPDDWPWDGRWGFTKQLIDDGFYEDHPEYLSGMEPSLMHELGHQLGRIDLYCLDTWEVDPTVFPPDGEIDWSCSRAGSMMHTVGPYHDDHTAASFNRDLHRRRGYYGDFLFDVPQQCWIKVVDGYGYPLAGAEVWLYQAQDRAIRPPATYHGFTDDGGLVYMGESFWRPINVVGVNSVMLAKVVYGGQTDFEWFEILDFNLAYWAGQTDRYVHFIQTQIDPGGPPTGVNLRGVKMVDREFGWAVGASGTILKFDGGAWRTVQSPTTGELRAVDAVSRDDAWAVGAAGTLLHLEGGAWVAKADPTGRTYNLTSVSMVSSQIVWIVGDGGRAYRTVNGGSSWASISTGTTSNLLTVFFADVTHGWIGGQGATLRYTTNGGGAWYSATKPNQTITQIVFPEGVTEGWACTDFGSVLHSTDGGVTWVEYAPFGYPNPLYGIAMSPEGMGWAVGWGQWVHTGFVKRFEGTSNKWRSQYVTTYDAQRVLNAVSLATPYEGWAVGDGGALVCLNAGVPEISPPDWIRTGANWVSVPHAPVNPDPRAIFEPGAVTSSFIRWDPVGKTLELFPEDFDEIEQGRSYWWFVWEGQLGAYRGIPSAAPFEISVPTAGWIWIGHPHAYPTAIADLSVRDEISGLVRTAWEDFTSPDPWLNWNILYWDTTARTVKIAGIDWGDDRMLRPWYGYRIWSMTEDLTLIVP